jgi:hydrogenase expression/formation protein HypC
MCLAIPGQVVQVVDEDAQLVEIEVAGVRRVVSVALLDAPGGPASLAGEWVLIHVGFALSRIDEQEAAATLSLLAEMGEAYEQELAELRAGGAG